MKKISKQQQFDNLYNLNNENCEVSLTESNIKATDLIDCGIFKMYNNGMTK